MQDLHLNQMLEAKKQFFRVASTLTHRLTAAVPLIFTPGSSNLLLELGYPFSVRWKFEKVLNFELGFGPKKMTC